MITPQNPQLHRHIVSKSGLLFDQISRQIIREFYEKSKTKSKSWIWWHKNSIVTRFETLKAQRAFYKALNKSIKESLLLLTVLVLAQFYNIN